MTDGGISREFGAAPPPDWWQRVGALDERVRNNEVGRAQCSANVTAQIAELRSWKKDQVSDIREIKDQQEEQAKGLDDFKQSFNRWLFSLFGGLVISLILLVINLVVSLSAKAG